MAKATITIKQGLQYEEQQATWFAATGALFNRVAAFYFEVIQAHEGILDLSNKEALTALEKLTHATEKNPHPVMPKDRQTGSIVLKVWTGTCWSWLTCRLMGRQLPRGTDAGSPCLVRRGKQWWLHTPVEKQFSSPPKIAKQLTTNPDTRICAVDLNLDTHLAVCSVQTAEGTILATLFIGGGQEIAGFRKKLFGRIARHRHRTGLIAEGEQDNKALWNKLKNADENLSHQVSARIVQFAKEHEATILVFEHLGKLKPEKGASSRRGNSKPAFPISGRIFQYARYKAWQEGIITSRVNPSNTSRECARCHALVIRYAAGQPIEGYTNGAPLVLCPACGMKGHADRNASLVIGQRLITRYQTPIQEKPLTPLAPERVSKETGVVLSQEAESATCGPSLLCARHGEHHEHGTAQEPGGRDGGSGSDMPPPLRY